VTEVVLAVVPHLPGCDSTCHSSGRRDEKVNGAFQGLSRSCTGFEVPGHPPVCLSTMPQHRALQVRSSCSVLAHACRPFSIHLILHELVQCFRAWLCCAVYLAQHCWHCGLILRRWRSWALLMSRVAPVAGVDVAIHGFFALSPRALLLGSPVFSRLAPTMQQRCCVVVGVDAC
jgi:hypothetical protein